MRICLATNGTHGDVFPFLALGRELASRGHEVWVLTHPYFKPDVDVAGLGFAPLAPEIDLVAILKDPDLFHRTRGSRVVLDWIRRSLPDGVASFQAMLGERPPAVLLAHYLLLGGRELCGRAGVPFINASLAPCAWMARDDPCPALQQHPGRGHRIAARALLPVVRPIARRLGDHHFARAMRQAGLAETHDALLGCLRGGELNLGMWSRHFRPPCADDPPGGVISGFAWYDGRPHAALEPALERFLGEGAPPIVFAMGSTAHSSAGPFYELAARACAQLGVRGVLLTGDPARAPRDLPAAVRAFGYAPFGSLFPRAVVTVHHGGIGSVAQALRAGKPSLVVPRAHDQFNNSVHVDRLGLGRALPFGRLSQRRLVGALADLLGDDVVRSHAAAMGRQLAAEDGARVAADYVEAFTLRPPASPATPGPRR